MSGMFEFRDLPVRTVTEFPVSVRTTDTHPAFASVDVYMRRVRRLVLERITMSAFPARARKRLYGKLKSEFVYSPWLHLLVPRRMLNHEQHSKALAEVRKFRADFVRAEQPKAQVADGR